MRRCPRRRSGDDREWTVDHTILDEPGNGTRCGWCNGTGWLDVDDEHRTRPKGAG